MDFTQNETKPYSPIYEKAYLTLPRDRKELNAWCRHWYATNPIVRFAVDLHAKYPLQNFKIQSDNLAVETFFFKMASDLNLYDIVQEIAKEYVKLGEVFPEAELDTETGVWKQIAVHNPDYIDFRTNPFSDDPNISLIPDAYLCSIIKTAEDLVARSLIDPEVIEYVLAGQNIPLNNFNVSYIFNINSSYDRRGTSLIEKAMKNLLGYDALLEAWERTAAVRQEYRRGLFHQLFMTTENALALDTVQSFYNDMQSRIAEWIERKIFRPISEINDFKDSDRQVITPKIVWQNTVLGDDYVNTVKNLARELIY